MPEIFYQASMLLLFLWLFNTYGLLIEPFRGDPSAVIPEIFYRESRGFQILWTPDRNIQGQAKNGSKVAGVTKRWESKYFQYCGPLIETFRGDGLGVIGAFRGDGTRCHCEFVVSLTWQSQVFYSI